MELTIYNKEGQLKATVSPADSSTLTEGLMTDYILNLSFVLFDCVQLDVSDYVDFLGKRYWMLEAYIPNQKSTIEWNYNVKFYGIESVIRRALCLKTVDNEMNAVFSLTAPAIEHVRLVVGNINRVMGTTDWKVGEVEATANLTIDYNATYCDAALSSIATAADTEYWIDGLTVNLCRCEHGELLSLGYGNGLKEITLDTNENAKFFTRLFPLGSTRNIDASKYGAGRLHLPGGVKYVEQNTHYGVIEHSEEAAFSAIYPRRIGVVGVVRHETKKGEDGKDFDIYYFTDPDIDFDPNKYEIGGLVKSIVFETGDLAGRDFEVNYNAEKKEFEVITQWPYGDDMQLPGALVMKPTDEYILYNITMPTEYYPKAEAEFATAVASYMEKNKRDKSVYKAPTDYIDLNERGIDLTVGQRVHLMSDKYFPVVGYRDSRITKITRKVNETLQADIEISDLANPGGKAVLTQGISEAKHYAQVAMAGLPDMIKSWENTPASDSNLYTAKKSIRTFISRLWDDVAAGMITFLKGIKIGHFVPGWLGSGSAITVDEKTGKTRLEVDEVLARDRFETIEFRFNRIDVIDGEQWSTFAFGTIKSVDIENQIAYLDLVDGELMSSHKNDLNRGIFHNISSANASERTIDDCGFYTQAGFSTSYFTPTELLAKGNGFKYALRAGTSQHPCAGMKFAAYGNPTNPSRRMSRVTNLKHTIYLKDVSVWQIDPNIHYGAAYGDLTGITINGVEFNGYSSFQTNGYFKGYIEFLPEQKEELKGKDGYSVSLSSYDAVVAVNSDGKIDSSLYDIINIVSGNESAYTGGNQIVTTKYKIQTTIQAICGAIKLEQSDAIGAGKYVVSVTPIGCEYHLSDGVITITKITQDKATLDIEINCEGIAVVKKTFTLTRVYAERGFTGADGKDIEFIYLRSKVDNAQSPESENTDGFVPDGWTDNPTGTTSEFIYELISRRIKVNGTWGTFSQPAPWARYAKDGKDGDSVTAKYSVNGTDWHDGFADGDIYMQLYTNGIASGSINRIVAEDGKNGQYTIFEFTKSSSATVAPTEGWQDAPPSVSSSEYLWMRSGVVTPPLTAPPTWTAVRIGGVNGHSVDAEYSADGTSWHTSFTAGDLYMRQRIGKGEWTPAFRIVGETGKNGQYTDYQFAANESLTDAPVSGWQDAPPVVSPGQYLWMRSGLVVPPETTPKTWTAVRIGGQNGNDGKDGPGYEIIFCRTKTSTAPAKPTGKNQDQYVPDGWTNDQTGTSALWPHEFASQRRKINGVWGSFSEPALWANYSFDGDDAYSVALSSYDAVVSVNSAGEIDSSLYDVVNVVSGQQLAYTGTYEVTTTKYKIQTAIYAWHGATQLVYSDTASTGKYSTTIEAVGCEYSIANGVITITRISQDKATLDIVVNCEGKITVNKTFTLTRVYAGQDANLLPWLKPWDDNKTMIDGEWVASPKMFSGTKAADGKLTGIAQGVDCITIDGKKRTGIFALVDNEVVFELDPILKKYVFKGSVYSDDGVFKGTIKTGDTGARVIINPSEKSFRCYNEENHESVSIEASLKGAGVVKVYAKAFQDDDRGFASLDDGNVFVSDSESQRRVTRLFPNGIRINDTYSGKYFDIFNTTSRNGNVPITEICCNQWPTSADQVLSGGVYVENGLLKVKP